MSNNNTRLPAEVVEIIELKAEHEAALQFEPVHYPSQNTACRVCYRNGATEYATKLHKLQGENERLKEALQEAFTTMEWMWENMRPADGQTLLQTDVFNRSANALNIIEQVFPEVKRSKHNNTFIDGE